MPSWAQRKANIRTAIASGRRPRFTADNRQIVSLGQGRGSYALLSRGDGQLTRVGKFYFEESGRQRPALSSFDAEQPLTRHGNTDYVTLRNNTQRAVRTLLPNGSFKVTRLGKLFFKDKYSEYIAYVPIIIEGIQARGRNAGSTYQRLSWLPANVIGAAQVMQNDALSEQDKIRGVKAQVLEQFSVLRTDSGRTEIHSESDESFFFGPQPGMENQFSNDASSERPGGDDDDDAETPGSAA